MNKEKEISQISYKLDGFKITKYSLNTPPIKIKKSTKVGFTFATKLDIDEPNNQIHIIIDVETTGIIRKKPFLFGSIVTKTSFRIENLKTYMKSKKLLTLPRDFMIMMFGIAFSTTRGAHYAKGGETTQSQFLLPLVDPSKLIPKPASVNTDKTK